MPCSRFCLTSLLYCEYVVQRTHACTHAHTHAHTHTHTHTAGMGMARPMQPGMQPTAAGGGGGYQGYQGQQMHPSQQHPHYSTHMHRGMGGAMQPGMHPAQRPMMAAGGGQGMMHGAYGHTHNPMGVHSYPQVRIHTHHTSYCRCTTVAVVPCGYKRSWVKAFANFPVCCHHLRKNFVQGICTIFAQPTSTKTFSREMFANSRKFLALLTLGAHAQRGLR